MGKRNQAEMKAFRFAEQKRMEVIEQLKKCDSYEDFSSVLNKIEEKKKKNIFKLSPKITQYHQQKISELDKEINQLKSDLQNKFPSPTVKIEEVPEILEKISLEEEPIHLQNELVNKNETPRIEIIESSTEIRQDELSSFSRGIEEETNSSEKQRIQRERETHLFQVRVGLRTLKAKQEELDLAYVENLNKGKMDLAEKYQKASQAAQNIYDGVDKLSKQYIEDGDLDNFKINGQKIAGDDNEDVKTLHEHRGWKSFLTNLAALIFTVGLAHAGYSLYKGQLSWIKPATDTGKKVENLCDSINSVTLTV